MKCPICNQGTLHNVDDILSDIEGYMFVLRGTRCSSCQEEFINEKEGQQMITIAKKHGIWQQSLKLHRKLSKSARGTVLRIPTDIEKDLDLKGTETVTISKIGNKKIMVEIE